MLRCFPQGVRILYHVERRRLLHRAIFAFLNCRFLDLKGHGAPTKEYSTTVTPRNGSTEGSLVHGSPESYKPDDLVSKIVKGNADHGVKVDRYGQLKIVSEAVSCRKHRTALVLSRASRSLERYDFVRLLGHRATLNGDMDFHGGLEEAFPLRHHQTLQRRDSWIIIFTTPAQAKEYQHKASELRYLAARHTPGPSPEMIHLSHGLGPEGPKRHNYTLTSPLQSLSLVAKLSPFDFKLQRAVNTQAQLTQRRHAGHQSFPVRFWIDQPSRQLLNTNSIKTLLELDGLARGSPWRISEGEGTVVRLGRYSTSKISQDDLDDDGVSALSSTIDNWRIDFQRASDAKRFVRVWHRKRLPNLNDLPQVTVKAEYLF